MKRAHDPEEEREPTYSQRTRAVSWILAVIYLSVALLGCADRRARTPPPSVANVEDLLDQAIATLRDIERDLSPSIMNRTRCVVVAPAAARSDSSDPLSRRGFVACRIGTGWSPPAPIALSGETDREVTSDDLILLVVTDRAMGKLLHSRLRVGADVSVVAGSVGADGNPGSDAEVLSYVRSNGVLAGAELGPLTIDQDQASTQGLYGKQSDLRQILRGIE
jgi:lipid-binding SYLF domain-containing protein